MKRMTQKDWKENYCCPVCRGNNIDSGGLLGPYEYERICEDCDTEFSEILNLVGYKITKKGNLKLLSNRRKAQLLNPNLCIYEWYLDKDWAGLKKGYVYKIVDSKTSRQSHLNYQTPEEAWTAFTDPDEANFLAQP